MKKTVLCLLGTLAACFSVPAQNTTQEDRLDSLFSTLYRYDQFNGNILVAGKGSMIYKKSFGLANTGNGIPNTDSTEFPLASVSKTFTSTAILQLLEKKKLLLDAPCQQYLPGFPYPGITIRHLLTHTSGLPDYELYDPMIKENPGKVFTNADVMPALINWRQPLAEPGKKWSYSNTNYSLLAILIERLSGMSFQGYLQRFIFTPAGMYHTYFQADPFKVLNGNRVVNYEYPWLFSAAVQPVDSIPRYKTRLYNLAGFTGQGNIMTTTGDMLRFDEALYTGRLLKQQTLQLAFAPAILNNGDTALAASSIGKAGYGLGWFIFRDTSAGKIVWHGGGVPGGLSIFMRNLSRNQAVIAFDNKFNLSLYRQGANAMNLINGLPAVNRTQSLIRKFAQALQSQGIDQALCTLLALRTDTLHYSFSEDDMNELGLQLLYAAKFEGHIELALQVLRLNILLYPSGFNTYDSYGEALAYTGKKQEAIFMYKRSIELNPGNEGGKRALKELQ